MINLCFDNLGNVLDGFMFSLKTIKYGQGLCTWIGWHLLMCHDIQDLNSLSPNYQFIHTRKEKKKEKRKKKPTTRLLTS